MIGDKTSADLFLTASSSQGPGFSPSVVEAVDQVAGVDEVSAAGWGQARFDGADSSYSAIDPRNADKLMSLDLVHGALGDLDADGVVVAEATARSHDWKVGDVIEADFAATGKHSLHIAGIYASKGWIADNYILSLAAQDAFAGPQLVASALVRIDSGADQGAVQDAIRAALADHPDAKVLNQEEFEAEASGFIDSLLTFVTVMLLLAVVIALLGIVNTLALSVFERTRELGLLRAVGMTRAQVRAMVRWESVVISLIGALSGAGDRHRRRTGHLAGVGGRGHHWHLHPRVADRRVRRAGGGGRGPGRHRPGKVGREGRRAEGGGHRLTLDRGTAGRTCGSARPFVAGLVPLAARPGLLPQPGEARW